MHQGELIARQLGPYLTVWSVMVLRLVLSSERGPSELGMQAG
jgi:hypothetical protein